MERGDWSSDRFDVMGWFGTVLGEWEINYD